MIGAGGFAAFVPATEALGRIRCLLSLLRSGHNHDAHWNACWGLRVDVRAMAIARVSLWASVLSACASATSPVPVPPAFTTTAAKTADVCALSFAEVARLEKDGQLDAALKEAKNAACPEHEGLQAQLSAITRELGDEGPAGSLADVRSLWNEAATHAARGHFAEANRAHDRALHLAEQLTGETAAVVNLENLRLVVSRNDQLWFSLTAAGSPALARMDVAEQPFRLEPAFLYEVGTFTPRIELPLKHADWIVVSGGQKVLLFKSPLAEPVTVDGATASLTPEEDKLVVGREAGISVIDTATGSELGFLKSKTSPRWGSIVGDGRYFAAFGGEGSFHGESPALLADLRTMKVEIDEGAVRASAISKSGTHAAAIVLDGDDQTMEQLLIWRVGTGAEPLRIPMSFAQQYELPGLVFDASEQNVQVGYAAPAGLGMRPSAKVYAAYNLRTGKRVAGALAFPPIDYHADEARQTASARKMSGGGYEPLKERYSVVSNNFSPNSVSRDGSTSVFVEAVRSGEDEWSDPRAVFVDQRTKKVTSRVALMAGRVGYVRVQLSPDGKWLAACINDDSSNHLIERATGAVESLPNVPCYDDAFTPDSQLAVATDYLLHLATRNRLQLPAKMCRIGPVLAPLAVCRE